MTERIQTGVEVDLNAGLILIDCRAIITDVGLSPGLVPTYSLTSDILRAVGVWKDDHVIIVSGVPRFPGAEGGPAHV